MFLYIYPDLVFFAQYTDVERSTSKTQHWCQKWDLFISITSDCAKNFFLYSYTVYKVFLVNMSMQNNSLEDSGEVIFHPRSQKADENLSREEMEACSNVPSTPNHSGQSENVNDLLLKAVEIMNRDLAEMKQNIGHVSN